MSAEQYQKTVNSLDKDIATLEKKKATADNKAAAERKKAESVSISKNASVATIKSKRKEIERHETAARKASEESADLQKKIADKRAKRNNVYLKLQKEEQKEQKKIITNMQRSYEKRITELEKQSLPTISAANMKKDTALPEYDVFVSHAWEDKESFADEFVEKLRSLNVKVWYDTSQMRWGDSMRQRIDDGLKKSKFGIVILSPNYIADGKYWTKAELDGLFQLESVNGKTLLPIWHNLTKKQVIDFSPIIANKKAMTTAAMTAQEIAEELAKLVSSDEEDMHNGEDEI